MSNYTPKYGPCPELGGNTDEILGALGYTADQQAAMKANGTTAPLPKPQMPEPPAGK